MLILCRCGCSSDFVPTCHQIFLTGAVTPIVVQSRFTFAICTCFVRTPGNISPRWSLRTRRTQDTPHPRQQDLIKVCVGVRRSSSRCLGRRSFCCFQVVEIWDMVRKPPSTRWRVRHRSVMPSSSKVRSHTTSEFIVSSHSYTFSLCSSKSAIEQHNPRVRCDRHLWHAITQLSQITHYQD